jgi:phage gpG-like protein
MSGIELDFTNLGEFKAKLKEVGEAAGEVMGDAVYAAALLGKMYVTDNIRDQKLVDTSNLINSVEATLDEVTGTTATASVGPRGVVYARIHEFGGLIKAKSGKYMTFMTKDGAWHKVKSVKMPARPYLRPAFDEHGNDMMDAAKIIIANRLGKI